MGMPRFRSGQPGRNRGNCLGVAMTVQKNDRALWPDLTRFGATMAVAVNPSTGKNHLQLRIFDVDKFLEHSGHRFELKSHSEPPSRPVLYDENRADAVRQVAQKLHEHGFEPTPRFYESILQRESPQNYDEFCRDNSMATHFDRFIGEGGVFISPRIDITPPRLQLVIPALKREDYSLRPLQPVRNADGSLYDPGIRTADIRLPEAWFDETVRRLQRLPDGEPGVYYSTPALRSMMTAENTSANEDLLRALTYLPSQHNGVTAERPIFPHLAAGGIHPFSINHRYFDDGLHGYEFNSAKTAGAGYLSRADAIMANGNIAEGVEREEFPHSWPIGVSSTENAAAPLILFVKDARFLPAKLEFFTRSAQSVASEKHLRNPAIDTPTPEAVLNCAAHVRTAYACFEDMLAKLHQASGISAIDGETGQLSIDRALSEIRNPDGQTLAMVQASLDEASQAALHLRNARKTLLAQSTIEAGEYEPRSFPLSAPTMVRHGLLNHVSRNEVRQQQFADFATGIYTDAFLQKLKTAVSNIRDQVVARSISNKTDSAIEEVTLMMASHDESMMSRVREDAGEKIGGARKDYYRSPLRLEEVSILTVRERAELITKDNIWPRPDYAQMRAEGRDPIVALFIKYIRDSLPGKPETAGYNARRRNFDANRRHIDNGSEFGLQLQQAFVETLSAYRDAFSNISSAGQLLKGIHSIREKFGLSITHELDPDDITDPAILKYGSGRHRGEHVQSINLNGRSLLMTSSGDGWSDASSESPQTTHSVGTGYKFYANQTLPSVLVRLDGRLAAYGDPGMINFSRFAAKELIDGAPGKVLNQIYEPQILDQDSFWLWTQPKSRTKRQGLEGNDLAIDKPHLSRIGRTGIDWRQGKDVDEALFMKVLGLRGIEYGEWIPKVGEESERQIILNMAFDGLCDLAHALKIPPKCISLGGNLALGFGSRGRGGWHAPAAHYEPSKDTINITRIKGAGFLAHEWAHALSYRIALASGVSQTSSIGKVERYPHNTHSTAMAMRQMMVGLSNRPLNRAEAEANLTSLRVQTAKGDDRIPFWKYAQDRLRHIVARIDKHMPEAVRESGRFLHDATVTIEQRLGDENWMQFEPEKMADHIAALTDMYKAGASVDHDALEENQRYLRKELQLLDGQVKQRAQLLQNLERTYADCDGKPATFWPKALVVQSDYSQASTHVDNAQKRSKPYWSTTEEMWARFFEAHVQRTLLTPNQLSSDYLVHGASTMVYPNQDELGYFSKVFDQFWEKHRTSILELTLPDEEKAKYLESDVTPLL
jgi:hypothetical protein